MIRVFLLLLVSVAGFWYLADTLKQLGPGYVLVYYNQYSVETSFWVALLVNILFVIGLYGLFRLSIVVIRHLVKLGLLPQNFRSNKAKKLQYQGTLAFLGQHWLQASEQLSKSAKNSQTPFLNFVMAARASLAAGDLTKTQAHIDSAIKQDDIDELSVSLLQLDLYIQQKDGAAANRVLQKLLKNSPKQSAVLHKAIEVYQKEKNWLHLQQLLPRIKKAKILSADGTVLDSMAFKRGK